MFRIFIIAALIIPQLVFGQRVKSTRDHAFSRTMVLSVEGGLTSGQTDYSNSPVDYSARVLAEYFFPTSNISIFGLRAFAGAGYLKGRDENKIPEIFRTDLIWGGGGIVYSVSLKDYVFPYIFAGGYYLYFNPKGDNNLKLPNNISNQYNNYNLGFTGEVGVRIPIANNLTFNLSVGTLVNTVDYLDDISGGTNNDIILTGMAGLSISFFGKTDKDNDNFYDNEDNCPDEPEDFDGYKDNDGCPDLDNDEDGIIDNLDKCPNQKEDFDGYKDEDGCPDLDNDNDGILDVDDKCPNQAEDIDGFQDNDGCPDIDNDNDGIPDKYDKCPDKPETRNGFEDEDGCPDAKPRPPAPKEMILRGSANFAIGKAQLNPAAFEELDKIIAVINESPDSRWRIEGHTDNTGSAEKNKQLSYERAQSVLEYFISKGLERNRFEVYGLGEEIPIADNSIEEGRTKNRRVVVLRID